MIERPWRTALFSDESTGDNSKDLRVPNDRYYFIYSVRVEYVIGTTAASTAGVSTGARQLILEVLDADSDVVMDFRAGATQLEATTRYYSFAPGNADLTSFRDTDFIMNALPPSLILGPAFTLRTRDEAAIDTGANRDDMQVHVLVGIAPGQLAGSGTG